MDRWRRNAVLLSLIRALGEKGSWCGETHVQKSVFFLQALSRADTGFDFILYKHGPYSFDLHDELAAMRADGFISFQIRTRGYGPSITLDAGAKALLDRFPNTVAQFTDRIDFIAGKVGGKKVVELERLATALLVAQTSTPKVDRHSMAKRIHDLKPHISEAEAVNDLRTVEEWRTEADKLFSDSHDQPQSH